MFDTEIVVFQGSLFVFGFGQDLTEPRCDMELSGACPGALDLRQLRECLLHRLADGGHRQSCLFEERGGETSILFHRTQAGGAPHLSPDGSASWHGTTRSGALLVV